MRPQPGQLERGLARMTIGVEQAKETRHRQRVDGGAHEMEQQIRVPVSGNAGNGYAFVQVEVGFLHPFLWMPMQRTAPFSTPHFSYGVDYENNEELIVHAGVLRWNIDESSHVEGATVQIAVAAPNFEGAESEMPAYKIIVHLTFQGYGAEFQEGEAV